MIAHGAVEAFGVGAEVAATIADIGFDYLDAPVMRVAYPDRPVPYARTLEEALHPTAMTVLDACRRLSAY